MDYFRNSMCLMEECLRESSIDKRDVHDVVLVGGSERVAKYQRTDCGSDCVRIGHERIRQTKRAGIRYGRQHF